MEGDRFKREGTYVYLELIYVDAWQKPTQFCKAIILQLKNKFKILKRKKKKRFNLLFYYILVPERCVFESNCDDTEWSLRIREYILGNRISV